jgi:hypothetical protein
VAKKTPPGSPWTRRHFLPRQERYQWQADKSKRRLRKTPCLFRDEKRFATGGEESVGGPDEIKRRDSPFVDHHGRLLWRASPVLSTPPSARTAVMLIGCARHDLSGLGEVCDVACGLLQADGMVRQLRYLAVTKFCDYAAG